MVKKKAIKEAEEHGGDGGRADNLTPFSVIEAEIIKHHSLN